MADLAVTELEGLAARTPDRPVRALLVAPEGLGRSTTLTLLAARLEAQALQTLVISCRGTTPAVALARALVPVPVDRAVFKALLAAPQLAALEEQPRRLAAEHLARLLGSPVPQGATASLDEESRREGAFAELARLLVQRAASVRLLLAFDDVHRTDEAGAELFDFLSHLDTAGPLFLLLSADADAALATPAFRRRLAAWRTTEDWPEFTLPPWEPPRLQALLVERGCDAARAARLAAAAHSSPALALGLLQLGDDPAGPLPTTLEMLRSAQVRALGPAALALASRVAALGDVAPAEAVVRDSPEDAVALKALLEAGVFALAPEDGPPVLRFTDARTARALAAELSAEEAEATRDRVATWAERELAALTPDRFASLGPLVVPLAARRLNPEEASLWTEALAGVLVGSGAVDEALAAAATHATRVRQLVLLRRRADGLLFSGRVDAALALVKMLSRIPPPPSPAPSSLAGWVLAAQPRAELDRWESLSPEAALAAVELTRAECLSHLVRREDAVRAFEDLKPRLQRLSGPGTAALWVRWAKTWSWFLCEILGRPKDALAACEEVRRRVSAQALAADDQALAFLRAQEMACSTSGDFQRAGQLLDEYLALAMNRQSLRDACLGWNARAILQFGQGELVAARQAFETSLELARVCGWLRREAIATHNLALVLNELGEWAQAHAAETRYLSLSRAVGNHAATAEGPAVLAAVALGRGDLKAAEGQLLQSLKAAEANGWAMLTAWGRSLCGRRRLLKNARQADSLELTRAKGDFLAALDVVEEHASAWTEELDPGEVYALYALTLKRLGQQQAAQAALAQGARRVPQQNVVSHRVLAVGRAAVEGQGLDEALGWFVTRGYARVVEQWRKLAPA